MQIFGERERVLTKNKSCDKTKLINTTLFIFFQLFYFTLYAQENKKKRENKKTKRKLLYIDLPMF
jgi:preprotein translocase subunit YajC